jgi:hypothetical protein
MAITLAEAMNVNGSGVATFTSACAANDLIVVYAGSNQSSLVAAGAGDNVNTGAYSSISNLFNSGAGKQVGAFYKKCNAAGTPVVTCTGGAVGLGIAMRFTGFTIGPTILVPDQAFGWPGTSTTAVNSGSINASQNAELFVALQSSGQNNASGGAGWTSSGVFANTGIAAFYQTGIASGTAESFTATLNAVDFPYALIQGFFDGSLGAPSYYLESNEYF